MARWWSFAHDSTTRQSSCDTPFEPTLRLPNAPCTPHPTHSAKNVLAFPLLQRHRYFRLKQRLPARE
jgi:hypothetical protein